MLRMEQRSPVANLCSVKLLRKEPAARRHERPISSPTRYVTDGRRLFRIVSLFELGSVRPTAELEDCVTLEVGRYSPDDLFRMRLRPVMRGDPVG
jgi:hypothetical protein